MRTLKRHITLLMVMLLWPFTFVFASEIRLIQCLKEYNDNGFVTSYWYDASGERTVKTSGENVAMFVNAEFAGGMTNTAKFSLYVSPYLVANQGGRYTKHIYIGTQRIVSKIGDLESYGSDPRRIEYAGSESDGPKVDYKTKYAQQQQVIKDNFAHFDVPYNGADNNDYVDGKGFSETDGSLEGAMLKAAMARAKSGNKSASLKDNFQPGDNYEKLQFFYHPDHLGSSSFITNTEGEVVQHIEYVPYGEVFIEERNNVWNSPYLFNAKEFDEETGLYYYGARYYDSRLAMWLGVDPMAEKYPNMGAYVYCANNPVKLVDPDGRIPRLYVEVQGVGHVFVTTGSGSNLTVYTYGRYAELGKNKDMARSTSPTGEGVLVVLKGKEAKQFVANQIKEKNAAAFEFIDACDSKVDEFYIQKFSNSNKIPTVGKYKDSDNARVIDEYNLINNNCATTSVQSILYGGGDVSSIIGDNIPILVAKNLHNEVANEQNPINHLLEILLGDYKPHIRLVPSENILKETKDE